MKKILMLVVLVVLAVACGKKEEKVYYIGLSADFAPFEYREGDQIVGFDVELAELISKEAGIQFKIEDIAFAGLLPALQTKKIDLILSGMSVTEERKKAVNFSNAYFDVAQVIIVSEDNEDIINEASLKGKKVGVALGTTSDTLAQGMEGINLVQYDKAFGAIIELNNKKIDAIILDEQQALNFVKANEGLKIVEEHLQREQYAMAFNKDNTELLDKVNAALDKIVGSEEYNALMAKYIK